MLFIDTDGGFSVVEGFILGNLEPEVVVIGPEPPPYSPPPEGSAGTAADEKNKVRNPSDNVAILRCSSPVATRTSPTSTSFSAACITSGTRRP